MPLRFALNFAVNNLREIALAILPKLQGALTLQTLTSINLAFDRPKSRSIVSAKPLTWAAITHS
ncbi:MAG: hypothetical protein HC936_17190 [Leptolyngbyaceae cyanobacterium SU_3_3]|nr:hypothetical protein [Leptolyngbyaceae cyanobacterium SU_3_3]NJR51202.1 hypothetical protein [Leptolyngbyaceae cyanobacterium CSU_1_3]